MPGNEERTGRETLMSPRQDRLPPFADGALEGSGSAVIGGTREESAWIMEVNQRSERLHRSPLLGFGMKIDQDDKFAAKGSDRPAILCGSVCLGQSNVEQIASGINCETESGQAPLTPQHIWRFFPLCNRGLSSSL